MAQKDSIQRSVLNPIADFALVMAAVGIVGLTYITVSGLSPISSQKYAANGSQVLGESTSKSSIQVFAGGESMPFVSNFTLRQGTSVNDASQVLIEFESLEATTYTFRALSIKNNSNTGTTVRVTPSFSIPGSYSNISLTYAGITQEIVSKEGLIYPLDIVIPENTIADVSVTINPITRLATKSKLSLDFTEIR